jgi:hypothetical protein
MRFVGTWSNANGPAGVAAFTQEVGAFAEITFYGTGLNLVSQNDATARDNRASVDGGAEGANFAVNGSGVLNNRNYAMNVILPVVSGLSLGIHTVKIRCAAVSMTVFGFEILNETQNIRVRPGLQLVKGKRRTLAVEDQESFNSGFETGTLGTRGGRVVIYQKADGSIGKAVTPTDATQLNLASANHASEEVVRVYSPREFGAGRADDFSTLSSSGSNRAFTLDDGTTTLVAANGRAVTATVEGVGVTSGTTNFLTFTFVGTALDIVLADDGLNTRNFGSIQIDGASSIGTIFNTSTASARVTRIVSGLPYGTHTVKFTNGAVGLDSPLIASFIVYQPKTPSIPTGAKAIAAYNVMANFAANSTAGTDTFATGVLRKTSLRELVYVNGTGGTSDWSPTLTVGTFVNGSQVATDRTGAYVEYTFFGTGFESRFAAASNRSANISVQLQSLSTGGSLQAATVANFPTLASSVYGTGVTFSAGTLDQQDAATTGGSGLRISGLGLGLWKVRFTNNSAGSFISLDAIDIITPIHSPKSNLYLTAQNTLSIGSQGIEDLRKIKALEQITNQKAISQAVGIASSPTTTSTVFVPMPDMSVVHSSKTGRVKVSYSATVGNSAVGGQNRTQIYVNGAAISSDRSSNSAISTAANVNSDSFTVPVPIGTSKVDLYWRVNTGTGTAVETLRSLVVEDV